MYLLLEFCPHGTLFDLIEQKCKLGLSGIEDEEHLLKIMNDIAKGLEYLHSQSISHRDIKLENVLLAADGVWKICDLGSCTLK